MSSVEEIKNNISKSDAWVLRAIFRLHADFEHVKNGFALDENANTDRMFFESLVTAYKSAGSLTTAQIQLARRKMRNPYVEYLTRISNIA